MWVPSPFYSGSVGFRAFETQMTRLEAEFVRREAPPSYGQLIAQGLIPPVEDFPVYNASQVNGLILHSNYQKLDRLNESEGTVTMKSL